MVYIVGDIHGEVSKLKKLVDYITVSDKNPSFVFVGDYIDKGENPQQSVSFLVNLTRVYECRFLIGNHEYLWRNMKRNDEETIAYLLKYGGEQTAWSFGCKNIWETKEKMFSDFGSVFFDRLIPFFQYRNYTVVHSGIPPEFYQTHVTEIPIEKFLFNRYPFLERHSYYANEYTVIFGHTAFFSPYYDGYKIGIDTGACFSSNQPITAFLPDSGYFINSDNCMYHIDTIQQDTCPNIIRNKPWRISQ